MRRGPRGVALGRLARLFESGTLTAASDRELLDRFSSRGDEAAFDALLARHGRLVLNIGRKLLRDPDDVEDVFQATFLVLVRKPPRLRVGDSLSPWLSTVAYRVAARARADRIRRNRLESTDRLGLETASPEAAAESIALALHEELARLPDRLRRPVVCCYLEGLTHEGAAARLGCPVGTVRSRLARARSVLHRRLVGRGVAPSAVPLEALAAWSRSSSIDPPVRLVRQTATLAAGAHAPWSGAGVASASLVSLVNGVVKMMNLKKFAIAMATAAPIGGVAAVYAAQAYQRPAEAESDAAARKADAADPEPNAPRTYVMTYYVGDLVGGVDGPQGPQAGPNRVVDLAPLVNLIKRTVEPGTWRDDQAAPPDAGLEDPTGRNEGYRPCSITPFYLSVSVIVQQTAQGHEQVADLLRNLRTVVYAAVARATRPTAVAGGAEPASNAPKSSRMKRMADQLSALQSEMHALEKELRSAEPEAEGK